MNSKLIILTVTVFLVAAPQLTVSIPKKDDLCEENPFYGSAFKCLDDDSYLWCVGEKSFGVHECGKGTECQCEGGFNHQNPCGSKSSHANCISDLEEDICEGNPKGATSFLCLGNRKFVTCYGETPMAVQKCPWGTKCLCKEDGKGSDYKLTSSNPCGTQKPFFCEDPEVVVKKGGEKKAAKKKGKK
jgi:hypothetical protein